MEVRWMTLEEASRFLGVPYKRLWDLIMGRVPGRTLIVYRLSGGTELLVRQQDLLTLLEPVTDPRELAQLEQLPPRPRPPGHLL